MREQFIYKIGSSAYGNDYLRLSESQLYWTDLIPRLKNVSDKIANEEFEYVKFGE